MSLDSLILQKKLPSLVLWWFSWVAFPVELTLFRKHSYAKKCGSKFIASRVQCLPLHDPSNTSKHHCNRNYKLFYPLQTCSSICGVVTATMAALLATDEHLWPSNMVVPHNMKWIENPSSFSAFLRHNIANTITSDINPNTTSLVTFMLIIQLV